MWLCLAREPHAAAYVPGTSVHTLQTSRRAERLENRLAAFPTCDVMSQVGDQIRCVGTEVRLRLGFALLLLCHAEPIIGALCRLPTLWLNVGGCRRSKDTSSSRLSCVRPRRCKVTSFTCTTSAESLSVRPQALQRAGTVDDLGMRGLQCVQDSRSFFIRLNLILAMLQSVRDLQRFSTLCR